MRLASEGLRKALISNVALMDILETSAMAGGGAIYQSLFTDLSPEEIAQSTLIGAGLGIGGRLGGDYIGRKMGRHIDTVAPGAFDKYAKYVPVTRDGSAAVLKHLRKGDGSNNAYARGVRDLLESRRNMAGADAGTAEAILSYYLRNRADNIAQGGYSLISPMFMGGEKEGENA